MRLIDADEIRWADHYDSNGNLSKYKVAYSDEMPPTVDAVPVIRCKDCRFLGLVGTVWKCRNIFVNMLCEPNDFCSRAERKEE